MMAKKKLIDISDKQIEDIYDSGKEATVQFIRMLVDKINDINEIVLKQQEEINQLKAIIQKNSQNSNKPPSSDNPFKKKTKSLRKKGGKAGGQNNHKGTNLKQVNNPDEIIPCKIEGKCSCGKSLKKASLVDIDKRQIFDLPEIQIKVTEYQADIVLCECGKNHTVKFPEFIKSKAG
jgi:transposase